MNILAIIPARGGSKGLKRKNIRDLNGKPLIAYTIEEAKKSKFINRIVVSTEDNEIAEISLKYGAEIPYIRPSELAADNSGTIDCVIHMLDFLKDKENYIPDYVCLLQCTSPLRTYEDIDGTIEKCIINNKDAAVSICEAEVNPYWTNVFNGNNLEYFIKDGKNITKRQDLPNIYRINGAVYIVKTEVLLEQNTLEPDNITGFIMDNKRSIDIDDIVDFMLAEIIIKS